MKRRIDEILPRVAKPARYTGGELNEVRKSPEDVSVRFALAFPDVYEVGMSNLGLRILYSVLNGLPRVAAERVFAPAFDMEAEMRAAGIPLFSLESSLPVKDADLIGFSLAYEMCATSVLNMLDLAQIAVLAKDRGEDDPIVIAGGHCTTNPEPMADFIDAFVIGEGEEVVVDIVSAYESARGSRKQVLQALSEIDSVYVPSVHGELNSKKIRSRVVWDLEHADFPDKLIVPFTEAVHDRVTVEIMRGCSRGCRFCQAGMITRPVRERSIGTLCEQAAVLLENTGYEEIALTSLSSADHSQIGDIIQTLIDTHEAEKVGISLPSLRADAKCVELAAEIQRVRKSGLTFAPEAGTQRLRDVINKNVTEENLLGAVETAIENGWRRIKLYFMIGLPTETDEDLVGIGDLVSKVINIGRKHRAPLMLNVTLSPFVPKPHTPFQWRAMDSFEELDRKVALVRPLLKAKNISLSWHDPRCSRIEAALARGDRRLGKVILDSWKQGGYLEQDRFDYERWVQAFDSAELDMADFANRVFAKDEVLPWEHIDVGVSKRFLALEDEKAEAGELTPDCRVGCSGCGVSKDCTGTCPPPTADKLGDPLPQRSSDSAERVRPEIVDPGSRKSQNPSDLGAKVLFTFKKTEDCRWLGHLDILRVFERAIRMSGIDVVYTQGFNPRAKMSIVSALPLGATADNELVLIYIVRPVDVPDVVARLGKSLPVGLPIVGAQVLDDAVKGVTVTGSEFVVEIDVPEDATAENLEAAISDILGRPEILVERESSKKKRTFDLRPGIESISLAEPPVDGRAKVSMGLTHMDFTVKPSEIISLVAEIVPGVKMASVHREKLIFEL